MTPTTPLLTIHKPELVGDRWVTSVKFSVKGQPVELIIHASRALGDSLINYGKAALEKTVAFGGVARCCKACSQGSEKFGDSLDHFAGVVDVVTRVAKSPEVANAIGSSSPLDEIVRQYFAVRDALSDPSRAAAAGAGLQQVFDLANAGDVESYSFLQNLLNVSQACQLLDAVQAGDAAASQALASIQLGAMQGDSTSLDQYLVLQSALNASEDALLVLHDADQKKTPHEAAVEIGRALITQRGMGARGQAVTTMLRAAMIRTMGKVHAGPTLVRAPYRPLLAA